MMNQKVKNLEEWAKEWQDTRCDIVFSKIFNQLKSMLRNTSKSDDEYSDSLMALFKALVNWDRNSNVWFFYFFQVCLRNERIAGFNERQKWIKRANNIVDLYSTTSKDSATLILETIPAPEQEEEVVVNMKRIIQFIKYHTKNHKPHQTILIRMIENKTQVEIAKELNITQSMVSKYLSQIKNQKYATKLKEMLKGER